MSFVIQGTFPPGGPRTATVQRLAAPRNGTMPPLQQGGHPLPPAVRQKMEALFATSFADVRVHVGPEASSIGAHAFTSGAHIHFAPGHYDPATARGQQLLGRELAHVVQQRTARVRNTAGTGVAIVRDPLLEAEAERMALRAASAPIQRIEPVTAGLIAGGLFLGGAAVWAIRRCMGGGGRRRGRPPGYVPPYTETTMRIPAGTSVFHGTGNDPSRWWLHSTPGLKNDEDGGVSYTFDPDQSPKTVRHPVILEYRFRRDVDATVCRTKTEFYDILTRRSRAVCYTHREREIKIRKEDGGHFLEFAAEWENPTGRPHRLDDIV